MENKESWVEKTLESMDNMQRANVPPQLIERLFKIIAVKENVKSIRPFAKWAVAASIIFLAGVNVISIIHCSNSTAEKHTTTNPVYKEYFSYLNEY